MTEMVDYKVQGEIELQEKINQMIRDLHGQPVLDAMRQSTLEVEGEAKNNLVSWQNKQVGGVDRGDLRSSITPEVTTRGDVVIGIVGSKLEYAPHVEYDCRKHFPPISALTLWAERHHTSAYLVAISIARKGTIGKKYIRNAIEKKRQTIHDLFKKAAGDVVNKR